MSKKNSYFYEIPLFYLLLLGVNFVFFPSRPVFLGVDPHPYWIGILIFGLRYGILSGFFVGVLSAALYLGISFVFVENYLLEELSFYILPSSFILVGLLVGGLIHRYHNSLSRLGHEKEEALKNVVALKEKLVTLEAVNQGLEKKIVSRMSTLVTLYEGARRLESLRLEELYHSILDFMAKTLGAEEMALYLRTPEGWQLKEKIGWKEYYRRPAFYQMNEGMTGAAGSRGKILTIRDFLGEGEESSDSLKQVGDAIAAGPLKKGEQGEVVGVVAIQKIPFVEFNSATINLFSFLLQWASRAVGRVHFIEELKSAEILDPGYQVYSRKYFFSRLHQEFVRSKSYSLPLSAGLVHVQWKGEVSRKENRLAILANLLRETVREMDVVSLYGEGDVLFAILLMTASKNQTEEICEKILRNVEILKFPLSMKLGFSSFRPAMQGEEEMIHEAKKQLTQ
ncbi:MAG: hypothetical protein HYW02_00600 [Deltaproteobacteria bacterium]|nr:hypothetical protein [Deltaproteobacteria bacterium]MBI2499984.1 hypothetical protein [Deltaproteobacteria bacterium]